MDMNMARRGMVENQTHSSECGERASLEERS
jgi:hypothetical protein